MRRRAFALAAPALLLARPGRAQTAPRPALPPEPEGYRLDAYRAPTPATLRGAQALDTPLAERVWRTRTDVSWINVLPTARRPEGLPAATLWQPRPQRGIPGSVWLPETGRGELSPALAAWFRAELGHATGGDPDVPVVFYCLSECWMGWNAGKRALSLGHRAVLWYRDGLDGWEEAGLPTDLLRIAPDAPI